MITEIDINCDLGESFGRYTIGNDEGIMPFITSANIACGFHGGDAITIDKTLKLARSHNLRIGAHPSFPDQKGFGRIPMRIPAPILKADIRYQIAALSGMAQTYGMKLSYVKPHGALYNLAARDEETARAVVEATFSINPALAIMGLAGSHMESFVHEKGMRFIREAFIDRKYTAEGRLLPRTIQGAVLTDIQAILAQVESLIRKQEVTSHVGTRVHVQADSLCIHGDTEGAVAIAQAVIEYLPTIGCTPKAS
ncbi:MAG: 5-oxoprolinase subunit PxpA [Bacteroidota bacterium]